MSLKVGIFEDDQEVAEVIADMIAAKDFSAISFYSFKGDEWKNCDIILGDYRNKIIPFSQLIKECQKNNIPLIAISGGDMDYKPQLIKPFGIDELQSLIFETLMKSKWSEKPMANKSWFAGLFKKAN